MKIFKIDQRIVPRPHPSYSKLEISGLVYGFAILRMQKICTFC